MNRVRVNFWIDEYHMDGDIKVVDKLTIASVTMIQVIIEEKMRDGN